MTLPDSSMPDSFKDLLCQAFTDAVSHLSLHTANPGTTGDFDTVHHMALSWSDPIFGISTASTTFVGLTGDYTHVGLWAGSEFRQGIECPISYPAPADVTITVVHEAGQK